MKPPGAARWLVGRLVADADRPLFLGDLDEEFATRGRESGFMSARVWYWRQALASALPLLRYRARPTGGARTTTGFLAATATDVRYALRMLRRSPGVTTVAMLSLSLGIGANTAIFELANAVWLRALPVTRPSELAEIRIVNMHGFNGSMRGHRLLTNTLWEDIRHDQRAFSGVFAWSTIDLNMAQGGEVRDAHSLFVSGEFFKVLGVAPALGRLLSTSDDRRGCPAGAAVISYAFWQEQWAGAATVLGERLTLEGQPFQIVGVTPPHFFGVEAGTQFDAAVPLCTEPVLLGEHSLLARHDGWWLSAMGRLKDGVSIGQASAQLGALSPDWMASTVPALTGGARENYLAYQVGAVPSRPGSRLQSKFETPLRILFGMTAAVLLIACANLANLLLARSTARQHEMAVRLAMGASRRRVVRQVLTESLLLSIGGAAVGLLVAYWMSSLLVSTISTRDLPLALDLHVDWRVLGFSGLLAILTCVAFGLTPALRASGVNPGPAMKVGGRGSTAARGRFGLQRTLVGTQVALSMALLAGALLFVRTFTNLMTVDIGLVARGVLTASIDLSKAGIPAAGRAAARDNLVERIGATPGVTSASMTQAYPLSGSTTSQGVRLNHEDKGSAYTNEIGPRYFATLGTSFLAGRDFTDRDTAQAPPVAIVNTEFARLFFGTTNPLGRVFSLSPEPNEPEIGYQIVGVVEDTKLTSLREGPVPLAYFPAAQEASVSDRLEVVLRTAAPTSAVVDAVKHTVADVNPQITLEFRLLTADVRDLTVTERVMAQLAGFFGALAVLLAVVGLYGVMSYMVARRRSEIGIRMVLGADRLMVVKMVVREAVLLSAIGLAVGTVAALSVARVAASLLYGLNPRDPMTFGAAAIALTLAVCAAAYIPARRAARLDPLTALRDP